MKTDIVNMVELTKGSEISTDRNALIRIHIEPNHVDVNYAENWELTELKKNKVNIFFGC